MTEEWIIKDLIEIGFTKKQALTYLTLLLKALFEAGLNQDEARIYLFLFFKGTHNARGIYTALSIHKRKTYRVLKQLEELRSIGSTPTFPRQFYAIPYEKVLDRILLELFQKAKTITLKKSVILAEWKNLIGINEGLK